MITGDQDVVPGYVADWHDHRSPFDRSPHGDKMLVIFEGGDHNLVRDADDADFAVMARLTTNYLKAFALGETGSRADLATFVAPQGVTLERR